MPETGLTTAGLLIAADDRSTAFGHERRAGRNLPGVIHLTHSCLPCCAFLALRADAVCWMLARALVLLN